MNIKEYKNSRNIPSLTRVRELCKLVFDEVLTELTESQVVALDNALRNGSKITIEDIETSIINLKNRIAYIEGLAIFFKQNNMSENEKERYLELIVKELPILPA